MTFYFFDNVFRLNLTFESTERILQGFSFLQSNFCHIPPLTLGYAIRTFDAPPFRFEIWLPGHASSHGSLADMVIWPGLIRSFSFFRANIEQRRLCCSMFAQFGHLIRAAFDRLLLPSLVLALCLILLSLLPGVFFLALGKR